MKSEIWRKIGFITMSLVFRWPVWGILWILRVFKPFDYLFLVYPGTDKDLDGYCPRKLSKSRLFSGKPTIGGIITSGSGGRGLCLVVPNTVRDFMGKRALCEQVLARLEWIRKIVGAESVAIAGQVPGIIARHGIELKAPFVRGNKGTVFCVMETIDRVMYRHGFAPGNVKIALVGVGYVGELLLEEMQAQGYDIKGIDIVTRRKGVLVGEEATGYLESADMVIVLTPRGQDFKPYARHLKPGAVVIDDTHPRIVEKIEGVIFYKVAVGMENVKFVPRLPGYKADWIPGCALEAIYSVAVDGLEESSQLDFNQRAKIIGFFAHLDC